MCPPISAASATRPGPDRPPSRGVQRDLVAAPADRAISSRPTSRRRAPTPSSATSGGSSTRSSRWSSTWSSCRSSSTAAGRTTRCSSSPRSCPGSGSSRRSRTAITSVTGAGQADPPDPVPQARAAGVDRVGRGIANFAFGLIPLFGLVAALLPRPPQRTLLLIPAIAAVQFFFNLALAIRLGALNVFYRDVGNVSRHVLRLWFYLSPALYSVDAAARGARRHCRSSAGILLANPWATLFTAYRDVIYYSRMPDWMSLARGAASGSIVCFALPTYAVQAGRAVVRQGPVMVDPRSAQRRRPRRSGGRAGRHRGAGLGVKYSLKFTRKTTLRQLVREHVQAPAAPTTSGRSATSASSSSTASRSAVIGPNGAGKSTLLQVLAGIITPSAGVGRGRRPHLEPADPGRRASTRT